MRLQKYDYSLPGAFFVTICTKDKAKIFWLPVGRDDLGAPLRFIKTRLISQLILKRKAYLFNFHPAR